MSSVKKNNNQLLFINLRKADYIKIIKTTTNQVNIKQNFILRYPTAIASKVCCISFLDLRRPGIICLERAHIGGSNHEKKSQWEPYNQVLTSLTI